MTIGVAINIHCPLWLRDIPDLQSMCNSIVASCARKLEPLQDSEAEVSLLFCDDLEIQQLNRQWRGQDKPTNVLSFPAAPAIRFCDRTLGDIALAYETVQHEASTESKSFRAHVSHLIIHGLLHLIGHDHENDADAVIMEGWERKLLAELGVADPYPAEDTENP